MLWLALYCVALGGGGRGGEEVCVYVWVSERVGCRRRWWGAVGWSGCAGRRGGEGGGGGGVGGSDDEERAVSGQGRA